MSRPERADSAWGAMLVFGWGAAMLILVLGCSQSEPVAVSQGAPATPVLPGWELLPPPGTSDVEAKSPEEIVAALAPMDQAKTVINFLSISLFTYRCHTGQFPSQEEGLKALVECPADVQLADLWQGPYSARAFLTDPWGRPYQYRWVDGPEILYELRSLGPDGVESEDDFSLAQLPRSAQFAHRDYVEHFARLYARRQPAEEALGELHSPAQSPVD